MATFVFEVKDCGKDAEERQPQAVSAPHWRQPFASLSQRPFYTLFPHCLDGVFICSVPCVVSYSLCFRCV